MAKTPSLYHKDFELLVRLPIVSFVTSFSLVSFSLVSFSLVSFLHELFTSPVKRKSDIGSAALARSSILSASEEVAISDGIVISDNSKSSENMSGAGSVAKAAGIDISIESIIPILIILWNLFFISPYLL
ncbi:MAG: hypothetical protein HFE83_12630 [Lachnospiraceae bacterium]|nr:hypothetical protein [Lachnospiraceae bacterium]